MNTLQDRVKNEQRLALEADLAGRMDRLFRGCPALCGFSVQDGTMLSGERAVVHLDENLFVADLACDRAIGQDDLAQVCEQIAHALIELVDEKPAVSALLVGRTFARTLH
jgi:hypothetical protein